jgi:hypothetical protein
MSDPVQRDSSGYPNMLAYGVELRGRYDPFDLFAGEKDIVTSQAQAADGQAIEQFQVVAFDINGRLVPWGSLDGVASQTVTFAAQPTAGDTIVVNGVSIEFIAPTGVPVGNQVSIGATAIATATNLAAFINGTPNSVDPYTLYPTDGTEPAAGVGVTAVQGSTPGAEPWEPSTPTDVLTLYAIEPGTAGNAISLTAAGTSPPTLGGADLAGGVAEVDTEAAKPIGCAAQPIPATTPGAWGPYFSGGVFNHQALIWPATCATLAQRKRAVAGTDFSIGQLL